MFLGTHTPKLDEKGRLILPARFREELADGLVITRGQERCLMVYPAAEFVRIATSMQGASTGVKANRDYQRMLAAGASDETPDKQGRITIPTLLRAYAQLDKELVVIGAMDHVEVWDAASWEAYSTEQEAVFATWDTAIVPGE